MESLISIPVSWGELFDKIAILEIKIQKIDDSAKLHNIRHELSILRGVQDRYSFPAAVSTLFIALYSVNQAIWDIEDDIREQERSRDFGSRFVELARSVYRTNDERAQLKREINLALNSQIIEEKSYTPYD
ncbi:hypothetical protein GBZ48_19210 [Azospirillum melinis]|uniref:Uncharacterized protein n=2 Tax=Azospirillum melinis TaxID=328839 RepID=A0ABX2KFT9_9PROT|nr:hypothetical protein [Azospirillum melinis]